MIDTLKYIIGLLPIIYIGRNLNNGIAKPFELKIKGNDRMVVSFKSSFGIKVNSIRHKNGDVEFNTFYNENIGELIIEKHTINNMFINDFPILSVNLANKKFSDNFYVIVDLIKKSSIKTYITYSTPFSNNNEIILNWATDATYIFDKRF